MLPFALVLLVLALVVYLLSGRTRQKAGLPGGEVIYADTGKWEEVSETLYDPVTHLTGRPDYLIRQKGHIIPVEVKSGRAPDSPYDSHIFQLAAYCLLVDRKYGVRPEYGVIHYGKRTFSVPYTSELEEALIDLLTEMRQLESRKEIARSHEQAARCKGCGYAYTCDQAMS